MHLSGNTILITGGTSGIGLAFAKAFLEKENTVIICGRRKARLEALQQKHHGLLTKVCDIASEQDREELAAWTLTHYPQVNILMNNAGIQLAADLSHVQLDKARQEIETNLIAPIHLTSLFAEHLKKRTTSAIINITSGLAFVPLSFVPVYCATKAALHSLTLSLRHQLKDSSIKVFEIAPPSVDTELGHQRRADKSQSHGGIPVEDFLNEAMEALQNDLLEAPIAGAKHLREKREAMFDVMNNR